MKGGCECWRTIKSECGGSAIQRDRNTLINPENCNERRKYKMTQGKLE